ncbi:MAG: Rrf2 family transcriptional regulator [Bacteriovoracaceae bacterium]|nr:Rrf2 family transcriptional regulator [Bacteriovoracaceae bacterium]
MLKINKKVEYALIALKLMLEKKESELTTAREISDKFHTPFDTTAKVMQVMNSAEILESVKGVKGGYFLSRDLSTLSYMDLAEMIEGKSLSIDCETIKCSLLGSCNISGPIKRLNEYVNMFFRDLSVKELLMENNSIDLRALTMRKETQHEL